MAQPAKPVQLEPQTLEAFEIYIQAAEAEAGKVLEAGGAFLWSDGNAERTRKIREGHVVARFWAGRGPTKVPNGLIHDWIGAAFIPSKNAEDVLTLIQDYDHHKNIYQPEVMLSRLIRRDGDDFQVYLRLLKKKIMTVVLDTEHEVRYSSQGRSRWICRSYTTRVAEVEDAGRPKEKVLPPDTGYGFLWRLYSYWRFEEREGGVFVECRAVSLSRDMPFGLGWVIEPIIQKLPEESLTKTLEDTRRALQTKMT